MGRQHTLKNKQQGSALFIMIMILVALTILTFMATNIGKTDVRISNAYTEQSRAYITAESMLSRLRFALEQLPLPEGISQGASTSESRPIWKTSNLVQASGVTSTDGEPDFSDPSFAHDENESAGWAVDKTLTCKNIEDWMKNHTALSGATRGGKFVPIDCGVFDPEGKTRTVIELINQRKSQGDIDDLRSTYYFRITVRAEGDTSGEAVVQGITGIQYN